MARPQESVQRISATAGPCLLMLLLSYALAGCGGSAEASEREGTAGAASAEPRSGKQPNGPGLAFPPLGQRPAASTGSPDPKAHQQPVRLRSANSSADRTATLAPQSKLARSVDRIVATFVAKAVKASKGKMGSGDARVAVFAKDLRSGKVLVNRLGARAMMPASNLKVLTACAALLGLGAQARFETRFEAAGKVVGGTLEGPLTVRAGADPMHQREGDGSLDRWMKPLADDLLRAGIHRIEGPLVLDARGFEAPGPAPEWPAAKAHWQAYCALSAGFSANGGVFRVTVEPRGGKAHVTLRPRHHGLKRRGSVSVKGKRNDLRVGANPGGVTVGGSVPASMDRFTTEFRHPDPIQLFGESIVGGLKDRGITFEDSSYIEGHSGTEGSRVLHTMRSPLVSVLEAVLTDSNNAVADQVFLLLGHRKGGGGTRAGAALAVRRVLAEAGVEVGDLRQADGSGLSKANRLTANCLVQALTAMASGPKDLRDTFVNALPVSGKSGGLKNRMKGSAAAGVVAAKTGWVSGASSLSGYVLGADGQPTIAFSILVGYPRIGGLNTSAWKPMQDDICALLANAAEGQSTAR